MNKDKIQLSIILFLILIITILTIVIIDCTTRSNVIQNAYVNKLQITINKTDERRYRKTKRLDFYSHRYKSPIVLEEYKLMWFLNPKVGSTNTKFLLAKMLNQNIDPKILPNNFKLLYDYPAFKAYFFLNSPGWTRVITLRDPKERILSAYLGKEYRFHTRPRHVSSQFRKMCFQRFNRKCDDTIIKDCLHHNYTFAEFLDATKKCPDRHWDPQYTFIDDWNYVNFVINFKDLAGGAEKLLRRLGGDVWDKYGKTGWGSNGTSAVFVENIKHSSNSHTRLGEFYSPELEKIVEERYARDYELLRKYFPADYF